MDATSTVLRGNNAQPAMATVLQNQMILNQQQQQHQDLQHMTPAASQLLCDLGSTPCVLCGRNRTTAPNWPPTLQDVLCHGQWLFARRRRVNALLSSAEGGAVQLGSLLCAECLDAVENDMNSDDLANRLRPLIEPDATQHQQHQTQSNMHVPQSMTNYYGYMSQLYQSMLSMAFYQQQLQQQQFQQQQSEQASSAQQQNGTQSNTRQDSAASSSHDDLLSQMSTDPPPSQAIAGLVAPASTGSLVDVIKLAQQYLHGDNQTWQLRVSLKQQPAKIKKHVEKLRDVLQSMWRKVHKTVRTLYRRTDSPPPTDLPTLRRIVQLLFDKDKDQFVARILAIALNAIQRIRTHVESRPSEQFVREVMSGYKALLQTSLYQTLFLSKISGHPALSAKGMSWPLINKYLFHDIVLSNPHIRQAIFPEEAEQSGMFWNPCVSVQNPAFWDSLVLGKDLEHFKSLLQGLYSFGSLSPETADQAEMCHVAMSLTILHQAFCQAAAGDDGGMPGNIPVAATQQNLSQLQQWLPPLLPAFEDAFRGASPTYLEAGGTTFSANGRNTSSHADQNRMAAGAPQGVAGMPTPAQAMPSSAFYLPAQAPGSPMAPFAFQAPMPGQLPPSVPLNASGPFTGQFPPAAATPQQSSHQASKRKSRRKQSRGGQPYDIAAHAQAKPHPASASNSFHGHSPMLAPRSAPTMPQAGHLPSSSFRPPFGLGPQPAAGVPANAPSSMGHVSHHAHSNGHAHHHHHHVHHHGHHHSHHQHHHQHAFDSMHPHAHPAHNQHPPIPQLPMDEPYDDDSGGDTEYEDEYNQHSKNVCDCCYCTLLEPEAGMSYQQMVRDMARKRLKEKHERKRQQQQRLQEQQQHQQSSHMDASSGKAGSGKGSAASDLKEVKDERPVDELLSFIEGKAPAPGKGKDKKKKKKKKDKKAKAAAAAADGQDAPDQSSVSKADGKDVTKSAEPSANGEKAAPATVSRHSNPVAKPGTAELKGTKPIGDNSGQQNGHETAVSLASKQPGQHANRAEARSKAMGTLANASPDVIDKLLNGTYSSDDEEDEPVPQKSSAAGSGGDTHLFDVFRPRDPSLCDNDDDREVEVFKQFCEAPAPKQRVKLPVQLDLKALRLNKTATT